MDKNILKIDLDLKHKAKAIAQVKYRLSYMEDTGFFDISKVKQITLNKKNTYGCKIILNKDLKHEWFVIMLQLMMGSDYRKEVYTMLNHYKYNMEISNRLFCAKRYPDGEIKFSKIIDITQEVVNYVKDKNHRIRFD